LAAARQAVVMLARERRGRDARVAADVEHLAVVDRAAHGGAEIVRLPVELDRARLAADLGLALEHDDARVAQAHERAREREARDAGAEDRDRGVGAHQPSTAPLDAPAVIALGGVHSSRRARAAGSWT